MCQALVQVLGIHYEQNTVKSLPHGAYILVGGTDEHINTKYQRVQKSLEISCLKSVYCISSFLGNDKVKREANSRLQQCC